MKANPTVDYVETVASCPIALISTAEKEKHCRGYRAMESFPKADVLTSRSNDGCDFRVLVLCMHSVALSHH